MTLATLIATAQASLPGVTLRPHHIYSAIRCGMIEPTRCPDGQCEYSRADVRAAVDYMMHRSRSARREREGAAV